MTNDLHQLPGFLTLNSNTGLGRLDNRQLEDLGVTRTNAGHYDRYGRLIQESAPRTNGWNVFGTLLAHFAPARTSRA